MTYLCLVCSEPTSPDFDHEHWSIEMDRRLDREIEAREDAYYAALAAAAEEWEWS